MITNYQTILQEFSKLPSQKKQLTYLELCRYPGSRFEEICSRLLCFYFDPNEDHSFKDLFIFSLLQLFKGQTEVDLNSDKVIIENEVYYNNCYLDILIETPSVVIGIENKINASLYNDLSIYANLIRSRAVKGLQSINILLSLNKIWRPHELQKLADSGFTNIVYKELFAKIMENIGRYIRFCDPKQLIFLNDFMKTIENMSDITSIINPEFDEFYYKNSSTINSLYEQCHSFFGRILSLHRQRMKELLEPIKVATNNFSWSIWDNWDDGIYLYEKSMGENLPCIGVECVFSDAKGNPFDKLEIYISTWNINDWVKFESFIRDEISIKETVSDNKTYILYRETPNEDGQIIQALSEAYYLKQRIVEKYRNANAQINSIH